MRHEHVATAAWSDSPGGAGAEAMIRIPSGSSGLITAARE
jgi:hypothetical protein